MQIRAILLGLLPPSPGGATFSVAQIVSGIARAGHEVCAVAPMTTEALREGGDWFAARHPELRVIRYWVPEFYLQTYKPRPKEVAEQERQQIERIVGELAGSFRPNVFIPGREVSGFLTRELAERLGLPWSMWLRGIPTAHILSGLFSEEEAQPFLDLYRSADQVIAVARYFCSGLEERFGITGAQNIPNAVDLDAFTPGAPSAALRTELGIDDGAAAVLLPGTFITRKRPMDLLKAAELVLERDRSVVFLLAGVGVMQDELMRFCRERGIADRVRFLVLLCHIHKR